MYSTDDQQNKRIGDLKEIGDKIKMDLSSNKIIDFNS